jgi:hypothetical protein
MGRLNLKQRAGENNQKQLLSSARPELVVHCTVSVCFNLLGYQLVFLSSRPLKVQEMADAAVNEQLKTEWGYHNCNGSYASGG